jgi:hypothetical protein
LYVDGEERAALKTHVLAWLSWQVFDSGLTRRLVLGLVSLAWMVLFLPLWILAERWGIRMPASALVAAAGAGVLLALVRLATA